MQQAVAALGRFTRSRTAAERCDSCGTPLEPAHAHTFAPATRQLRCSCEGCAATTESGYHLVPQRVLRLWDFEIDDAQWDRLAIPIGLAFFSYRTPVGRVVAQYPGPAGAAESLLSLDAWTEIAAAHPAIEAMLPDVEVLLVNRIGATRDYYIAPIDECYRLAGLIRKNWRGLGGGAVVWGEIARFFLELRPRGEPCPV